MWINEATSPRYLLSPTDFLKQGCVLAPTLFSPYLTMLKAAFDGVGDGIFIHTRTNADLFNVPLFKAKTRTT